MSNLGPRDADPLLALLQPVEPDEGWPAPQDAGADAALDVVVFSKDRACQLDALLRTVRAFLDVPHRLHVLYAVSGQEYERGYDWLRAWHPGIRWIDDCGMFRTRLVELLAELHEGPGRHLMYLGDDMLLTRPFTAHEQVALLDRDEDVLAVSLRLGEAITYCYMTDRPTTPPDFRSGHRWAWKTASRGYWHYPMSHDGNIFRTADLVGYVAGLSFGNPNSLEAAMAGKPIARPHLVCEPSPTVINLALNLVQATFSNRNAGLSAESFNDAFVAGFALDVRPFVGATFDSCHIAPEVALIPDRRRRPQPVETSTGAAHGGAPRKAAAAERRLGDGSLAVRAKYASEELSLNPTAEAIWSLCDGQHDEDAIVANLAAAFDADPAVVREGVASTLSQLGSRALILRGRAASGQWRALDLRAMPCFVISCAGDGDKRAAMRRQLVALGMRPEIVPGVRCNPSWVGVALSHLKTLRMSRARPPFVVLEDDCVFNESFRPVLEVPAETDALYLGVSQFGLPEVGRFGWGQPFVNRWEEYAPGYVRIFNMLARHAVVYLSADYRDRVIASQVDALTYPRMPYPGDIGCAMQHATSVVLTPDGPHVCRQRDNDGTAIDVRDTWRDPLEKARSPR